MTKYETENDRFATYKENIGKPLMTGEEARKRLGRVEQFASERFFPLAINREIHPYLYVK